MDPISATASIASLVDVALRTTSALITYARDAKHASSDRKLLAEEAAFLSKLLERLRQRTRGSRHDEAWLNDHKDIVRQFEQAYEDLAMTLKYDVAAGKFKEESRFQAARTAAKWSFTKSEIYSLLERVTRLQQYANLLISDDHHSLLQRIDEKQQEATEQKLKSSIMNWLSPLQMAQFHQTISDRPEKNSGKWFITSEQRPEASRHEVGIVFMYLKYNEPDQTIDNIFANFLKQLVQESDPIPVPIIKFYEHYLDRHTSPSLSEIVETLASILEDYSQVYCIIDALDECGEELRWELLENLERLQPKLRLLITSRFLDSIAEELPLYERFKIKANKADIELFIDHQIKRNRNLRKLVDRSSTLRDDIKGSVVKTAEDMFLLARLHVESLASAAGLSIKHVRNKLKTLPTTLTGTYDDAMQRIDKQAPDHTRIALKALAWVSYALRPLSLKELQHAIAVEPGDRELDEELIMDGQSITQLCAGLVIVDQRTNVVNLVHYTTKNYFDDIRHVKFPEFHANITLICATYLTLDTLKGAKIWEMVHNFPLACYAAQYMGDHARHSPEEALDSSTLDVICHLLSHPDNRKPLLSLLDALDLIRSGFYLSESAPHRNDGEEEEPEPIEPELPALFGTALELSEHYQTSSSSTLSITTISSEDTVTDLGKEEPWETKIKSSRIPEVTALHLAASMGLAKIASLLLKETTNIDAVDETGKTALGLALERGFEKAVELLINSGACVDLRHDHGQAILLLVNERDWRVAADGIVARAREAVDKEAPGTKRNQLSLLLAAYDGDVDKFKQVKEEHELDLVSEYRRVGETSLFLAIERQDLAMAQMLISLSVDVDAKDNCGQTALHRATRRKNERLIKLLLSNKAEVDCKDDDGRTPWSANVRSQENRILDMLREAGADPSTKGLQGVSELYTAAKDGETDIVRFMLKSGTDPSIQTNYQWAPLHWAASYGHTECVRLLLGAGADISVISDQRVTPLDLAVQAGQSAVVAMLSAAGAKHYHDFQSKGLPAESVARLEEEVDWVAVEKMDASQKETSVTHMLPEIEGIANDQTKLRLVYDKPLARTLKYNTAVGQYLYMAGTSGPSANIYEVSQVLETQSGSISVRHSPTRADMWDYPLKAGFFDEDDVLYDIVRMRLDYQEFELQGRHQDPLPGTIRMHRDWTGGWKIRHDHKEAKTPLFRTTPDWSKHGDEDCRWSTENGMLLARSGWEDATPILCFEVGAERSMQDIIVACWITKLWSETAALQRHD
ncbi:MAG: hypothetical protein Q9166_003821 [cf. Caloplaca sp. 2 TL-2023]